MPDPLGGWSFAWPYFATALAVAYLIGSIPFGLLLTWLTRAGDLRRIGSGNIGATNVLRTGHKGLAALTLLLDAGKGVAAVLLGQNYGPDIAVTAGLGVVLGHMAPVWLLFRGGKGVATTLGVLLALSWPAGLAAIAVWLLVAALSRYSSLAALIALAHAPVYAWAFGDRQVAQLAALLAVLVWLRHAPNIGRLLKGKEPPISLSSSPAHPAPAS
jgi:glycerol-3-phosphate acyltransferase PlsY